MPVCRLIKGILIPVAAYIVVSPTPLQTMCFTSQIPLSPLLFCYRSQKGRTKLSYILYRNASSVLLCHTLPTPDTSMDQE